MTQQHEHGEDSARIVTLEFVARRVETDEAIAALAPEPQAALRQFSLERMISYGVDHADAVELRSRVLDGQDWRAAANALALAGLPRVEAASDAASTPTWIGYLRRTSALLRMSQMMMLSDTAERRDIYANATALYEQAAAMLGDRQRILIETGPGRVAGWLISAGDAAVGSVIVIGGIEGWAMDFDGMGEALAARGLDVLMLDGPGQGETRLLHQHYLTADWRDAYRGAIDLLERRAPGRPIGFIGNSMGGSFAMAVAAGDTRIRACCNNGGIIAPWMVPAEGTFFSKMVTFCDTAAEQAVALWKSVTPVQDGPNTGYPLLIVQGGKDPMVSTAMSEMLLARAPTKDKQMVIFSDGDHCIYNHQSDRDALIADWMSARLRAAAAAPTPAAPA